MELREFITTTLLAITEGVDEANKQSPRFSLSSKTHDYKNVLGEDVEFDVAVVADRTREKAGKGSVGISVVSLGGETHSSEASHDSHRLKFRVFIVEGGALAHHE